MCHDVLLNIHLSYNEVVVVGHTFRFISSQALANNFDCNPAIIVKDLKLNHNYLQQFLCN